MPLTILIIEDGAKNARCRGKLACKGERLQGSYVCIRGHASGGNVSLPICKKCAMIFLNQAKEVLEKL